MKTTSYLSVLKRAFAIIKSHKGKILFGILLSLSGTVFSLCSSYTLRILIDDILIQKRIEWLWPIQFIFIAFVLLDCTFDVLRTFLFNTIAKKSLQDIRSKLFEKILHVKYSLVKQLNIADLINKIQYGVDGVASILTGGIPLIFSSVITIVMTLSLMAYIDWRLTLISLPIYPLLILANKFLNGKLSQAYRTDYRNRSDVSTDVEQVVKCIDTIRTHNLHNKLTREFETHVQSLQGTSVYIQILYVLMRKMSWTFIMVPYQAILYGIGGMWFIKNGNPTIGTLLLFANFTNFLIQPVMTMINIGQDIARARSGFEQIDEVMSMQEDAERSISPCKTANAVVEVENLTFRYDDAENNILQNLTATIQPCKTTVLWGPSGSGKSTLLKIIAQLLQPSHRDSVRCSTEVVYFPQNPVLFNKTVRENFLLVNEQMTEKRMWELLEMTGLKERLTETEEGLDFTIKNTEQFSGGEHRRLCLAVFLATDKAVLLLDEPTASLDKENAQMIADVITALSKTNLTVVVSTHDELLKERGNVIIAL